MSPAVFHGPYIPHRPEPAVLLPLLGCAMGALLLAGFIFGVACLDGLACITVGG